MKELSVKCPACGGSLTAMNKDELVKVFKEHAHKAHEMDMSEDQAREKVEEGLAASSDDMG